MPKRTTTRDQDGIYRRPDSPFWWASWTDSGGKTPRRSTGIRVADDPRGIEAKRARARMMSEAATVPQGPTPPAMRTWDDLIEQYLDGPCARKAPATRLREENALKNLFPAFTGKDLDALGGAEIRAYIAGRRERGDRDGTIAREIAMMSAVTNWAIVELEWSIPNPWQKRKPKAGEPRGRWLKKEEAARLLDAAETMAREDARAGHLPDFVRLALYTGMRTGEVLGLEWLRVDLEQGLIHFGAGDQKSRKVGSIPINQQARLAILSRLRARRRDTPWLFAHADGTRIKDVKKSFASAAQRAGLEDVHPHDLRRTFGSWLAQAGVPIQQISKLMRHSGIEITHRVYAHLSPTTLADAAAVLDRDAPRLLAVK